MKAKRQIGASIAQRNDRVGGRSMRRSAASSMPRVRAELDPMFYPDFAAYRRSYSRLLARQERTARMLEKPKSAV